MTLTEKVAHLKGVIEGMELADDKYAKLIKEIADILEDMSLTVSDLDDEVATLGDYAEELDEDLGALEEFVYDDDCDCCDDDCDCDCCDDDFVEVECPNCGEIIYLDEESDCEEVICPNCNEHFDCCCDCAECDECCD